MIGLKLLESIGPTVNVLTTTYPVQSHKVAEEGRMYTNLIPTSEVERLFFDRNSAQRKIVTRKKEIIEKYKKKQQDSNTILTNKQYDSRSTRNNK
uniref:Putative ovule protein n=1 Tax=Solanum chacoense TaxID=4108 RepID=A0A0V0HN16_SOLCH